VTLFVAQSGSSSGSTFSSTRRGFAGRILPVEIGVARRAAQLHVPDPRPERDAYIAATALELGMPVVTHNVADFEPTGVALVNPWAH
jgi:toxin FitB